MSIGQRILSLRKALKLTQEEFSLRLKISKGFLSNLEKGVRVPSDQLIRLISYEFSSSENWLETGEGEMFISPRDALKNIMARFGEQAIIEAFRNMGLLKEEDKIVSAENFTRRLYDRKPDLKRMVDTLYTIFTADDQRLETWASVQFDRAFPADVVEEAEKKQQEIDKQSSAG